MKRILALLMTFAICITMCACGGNSQSDSIITTVDGTSSNISSQELLKAQKSNEYSFKSAYDFAYLQLTGKVTKIDKNVYGSYIEINDEWKAYYVKSWTLDKGLPDDYSFETAISDYLAGINIGDVITLTGYIAADYCDYGIFVIPESISANDDLRQFDIDTIVDISYRRNSIYYTFNQESIDAAIEAINELQQLLPVTADNKDEVLAAVKNINGMIADMNEDEIAAISNYDDFVSVKNDYKRLIYKDVIRIDDVRTKRYTSDNQLVVYIDFTNTSSIHYDFVKFVVAIYDANGNLAWSGDCEDDTGYNAGASRSGDNNWWDIPYCLSQSEYGYTEITEVQCGVVGADSITISGDDVQLLYAQ